MTPSSGGEGLFASLKTMAATLVAMGKTRIELIGNELAVEKERALRQLVLVQLMLFFFSLAIVLAAGLLVLAFWEQRIALLAGLALLFGAGAGLCYGALRRSLTQRQPVFADSLAELQEDLRRLQAATHHEQQKTG
jgi:uncharacterized membrane protein YqjE